MSLESCALRDTAASGCHCTSFTRLVMRPSRLRCQIHAPRLSVQMTSCRNWHNNSMDTFVVASWIEHRAASTLVSPENAPNESDTIQGQKTMSPRAAAVGKTGIGQFESERSGVVALLAEPMSATKTRDRTPSAQRSPAPARLRPYVTSLSDLHHNKRRLARTQYALSELHVPRAGSPPDPRICTR